MPRLKSTHVADPVAFGQRLRQARLEAGLSQRELSGPGVSSAYISRIEAGQRVPSLQIVRMIADRLGVSEAYLLTGESAGADEQALVDAELALRFDELDEAERTFRELLDEDAAEEVKGRALAGLGQLAFRRDKLREAIAHLEEALTLLGDERRRPDVVEMLGRAYAMSGQLEEAIALFQRALDEAETAGDAPSQFRFGVLLANALIDAGLLSDAQARLGPVIAQHQTETDPLGRARIYWTQSRLHATEGQHDLAAMYAQRALELLEDCENTLYQSRAHQTLAYIELDRGNPTRALELIDRAEELLGQGAGAFDRGKLLLEKARALLALGESDLAATLAHEAAGLLAEVEPYDRGRAYLLLGAVFADLGDRARALEIYELAEEVLGEVPTRYRVELYQRMSVLLEEEGRPGEALQLLKKALTVQASWHAAPQG